MLNFGRTQRTAQVFLVGVGGTGGYLSAYVTRFLSTISHSRHTLTLCDGDTVAPHNLTRQNFIDTDLNKNKAQVLSERYNNIYNLTTGYVDQYIEDEDSLLSLFYKSDFVMPVVIGCVDNNRTRQVLHQVFEKAENIIYIDSGNDEESGQVVVGVKVKGVELIPPVGKVFPDILQDNDTQFNSESSCSANENTVIQSMPANLTAGGIVFSYLYSLLKEGTLPASQTTFNALCPNVRSVEIPFNQRDNLKGTA